MGFRNLSIVILLLLAGCGNSDPSPATPTQAAVDPATPAPAAENAPAPAVQSPIVGTWNLDSAAAEQMAATVPEDQAFGLAIMSAMSPSYEFRADGTLATSMTNPLSDTGERETKTGRYQIANTQGNVVTVTVTEDTVTRTVIFTIDGNTARMQAEGDPFAIPMTRG